MPMAAAAFLRRPAYTTQQSAGSPRGRLAVGTLPSARRPAAVAAAAACRLPTTARRRSTGRSTGQMPPPINPNQRNRAGRRERKNDKPFDAELLVLFGLPALVLVIAFAFNEPGSLAIALPLALLVPGPRDVLLHVASDLVQAARRARRFVSTDSDDYAEGGEAPMTPQERQQWRQQRERWWAGSAQPPPPPPPPPVLQVEYELQQGEYAVYQPPPAQAEAGPRSSYTDSWQATVPPPADWQQQRQQEQQQAEPLPPQQQQPPLVPRSPFAAGWPPADPAGSSGRPGWRQPPMVPRSPFADGWPAEAPASPSSATGLWPQASRGAGPAAAANPRPARAAVARRQRQKGRLVRPARKGRVGVDVGVQPRDTTPLLLRPIFFFIPFLRYWGGFL